MNADPLRPPDTDEEPWTVALPPADPALIGPQPYIPVVPLVIALGVIVGIVVAWAVR